MFQFRMSVLLARENDATSGSKDDGKSSPLLPSSKRPSKRDKAAARLSRDTVLVVNETLEVSTCQIFKPKFVFVNIF